MNEAGLTVTFHIMENWYNENIAAARGHDPRPGSWHMSAWQWNNLYGERPIEDTLSALIFDNLFGRFGDLDVLVAEFGPLRPPAVAAPPRTALSAVPGAITPETVDKSPGRRPGAHRQGAVHGYYRTGDAAGLVGEQEAHRAGVRLIEGAAADLAVFGLDELDWAADVFVADLPEGVRRLSRPAGGYRYPVVAGAVVQPDGELTGGPPGPRTAPSPLRLYLAGSGLPWYSEFALFLAIACLTRATSTFLTESRCRASQSTTGVSGSRSRAIRTSSGR